VEADKEEKPMVVATTSRIGQFPAGETVLITQAAALNVR
jgi:hypothetical protein